MKFGTCHDLMTPWHDFEYKKSRVEMTGLECWWRQVALHDCLSGWFCVLEVNKFQGSWRHFSTVCHNILASKNTNFPIIPGLK